MSEDRLVSVQFKSVPLKKSFSWHNKTYIKISSDRAVTFGKLTTTHKDDPNEEELIFPFDFRVNVTVSHAWEWGIEIADSPKPLNWKEILDSPWGEYPDPVYSEEDMAKYHGKATINSQI